MIDESFLQATDEEFCVILYTPSKRFSSFMMASQFVLKMNSSIFQTSSCACKMLMLLYLFYKSVDSVLDKIKEK